MLQVSPVGMNQLGHVLPVKWDLEAGVADHELVVELENPLCLEVPSQSLSEAREEVSQEFPRAIRYFHVIRHFLPSGLQVRVPRIYLSFGNGSSLLLVVCPPVECSCFVKDFHELLVMWIRIEALVEREPGEELGVLSLNGLGIVLDL